MVRQKFNTIKIVFFFFVFVFCINPARELKTSFGTFVCRLITVSCIMVIVMKKVFQR